MLIFSSMLNRPIIHILFLGVIVYQFTTKGTQIIIERVSWRFIVLMLASTAFVCLWAFHEYLLGEHCTLAS